MAKTAEKAKKGRKGKGRREDRRHRTAKDERPADGSVDARYTKPKLRRRLKEEIQAGGKGGKKGQWSARKAQLLVKRYEKAGGGYVDAVANGSGKPAKRGKGTSAEVSRDAGKDERQRSLSTWTEEQWQTREGATRARRDDVTDRYLPKQAWHELSEAEQAATDEAKRSASRSGQQFVANPPEAKAAVSRVRRRRQPLAGYDSMTVDDVLAAAADAPSRSVRAMLTYEKANRDRKTLVPKLERQLAERS